MKKTSSQVIKSVRPTLVWLAGGLFFVGVVIFGYSQLVHDSQPSLANNFQIPFSSTGSADWCSSTLQANLNSTLVTQRLGGGESLSLLATIDCEAPISLISQADWQTYKDVYRQAIVSNSSYLPTGVTNSWTKTAVTEPAGDQVFQILPTGDIAPANVDTLADALPLIQILATTACTSGNGTASDPYIIVDNSLCFATPSATPTPTPTPTPAPTPGSTTKSCGAGYYLSDNECRPNCNVPNCQSCSSPNYCSDCHDGYSLRYGSCLPDCNVTNCQTCNRPNFCQICTLGFTNINGQCRPVPTPAPTPTPAPPLISNLPPVITATQEMSTQLQSQSCTWWFCRIRDNNKVLPDLYTLAKIVGLSDATLNSIQNLATKYALPLLLILELPLAIILAIFPLPRGKALPDTRVTVSQNGVPVAMSISNQRGNYYGFHLPVAEYLFTADKPQISYEQPFSLRNNSYHHNLSPNFAVINHQPPVPTPTPIFIGLNHLANAAGILLLVTTIMALTYLTPLGIVAIATHIGWIIRRMQLVALSIRNLSHHER